ncbi:tyrosine-type recombinase/integrase [Microcoleus asticus]|uniref:Tyrosine recombinase XerD n=1 Tax=Microcoleus asticus IPMA8 TaxID=2563858 RepID=A0ABX2D4E5_9CYAN|nr:Tyrosine recombinase XerD [Microcoleus asticus IPMA8]
MKIAGIGQATPLTQITFNQISNQFTADVYKLFLGISWYTGERPGAILKIDVSHIYQNAATRQPRDTVLYPARNRKDRQTRELTIHRALKLILAAYQPPETGFLFPSLYRADKHLSQQAVDKAFRRAVKKAGLEYQGFSLYSARRGFITHLNEQGCSLKVIQKATGHRSISSLMRYVEVSDLQVKNAIDNF